MAWGFHRLYQVNKDAELIKEVYDKLAAYLDWDIKNRKVGDTWLFGWDVNEDDPNCCCDECGMDNSPRFDDVKPMYSIDFSCFMAQEARCMAELAEVIGKDASYWKDMYANIKVEMMLNEDVFWSVAGVATVSKDHPTYGTDMWRGPIWIVYNYLTVCGLSECGFTKEAEELRKRTLDIIAKWYLPLN